MTYPPPVNFPAPPRQPEPSSHQHNRHSNRLVPQKLLIATVIVLGLLAVPTALLIASGNFDLRNFAFTNVQVEPQNFPAATNQTQISDELRDDPTPLAALPNESSMQVLFHQLSRTYPAASVEHIAEETVGITGVAGFFYDEPLDASVIFIRLADMPYFATTPLYLWLGNTRQAVPAEFVVESDHAVAYITYTGGGDLRNLYDTAVLSYDQPGSAQPVLPVVTLTL